MGLGHKDVGEPPSPSDNCEQVVGQEELSSADPASQPSADETPGTGQRAERRELAGLGRDRAQTAKPRSTSFIPSPTARGRCCPQGPQGWDSCVEPRAFREMCQPPESARCRQIQEVAAFGHLGSTYAHLGKMGKMELVQKCF